MHKIQIIHQEVIQNDIPYGINHYPKSKKVAKIPESLTAKREMDTMNSGMLATNPEIIATNPEIVATILGSVQWIMNFASFMLIYES